VEDGDFVVPSGTGWLRDTSNPQSLRDLQMNPVALPGATVVITQDDGTQVRALVVDRFHVDGTLSILRITGDLPLLVYARRITIDGVVDASGVSTTGQVQSGPGSDPMICRDPGGASAGADGAGGGGGGFGTAGGSGGSADSGATSTPGLGGVAGMLVESVRGGCDGGGLADLGGPGGGGLQLTATEQITISGAVKVGGGGGIGAPTATLPNGGGGGGGGSGGFVGLDAPQINIGANAEVIATGGGGGEGATSCAPGLLGLNGSAEGPAEGGRTLTPGCASGSNLSGGDGGTGAWRNLAAASGGDGESLEGGGGGGGGLGVISFWGDAVIDMTAVVVPSAVAGP
jgi:hypothetical protein